MSVSTVRSLALDVVLPCLDLASDLWQSGMLGRNILRWQFMYARLIGLEFGHLRIYRYEDPMELTSRVSFIFDDLSPTHGRLPIAPRIDVPKYLSSEMSLEVA